MPIITLPAPRTCEETPRGRRDDDRRLIAATGYNREPVAAKRLAVPELSCAATDAPPIAPPQSARARRKLDGARRQ